MAVTGLVMASGCEKPADIAIESVSVEPETLSLAVGETYALSVSVFPEDAQETVSWSSSAADVASVDNSGTVTAMAAGEAVITVTAGGKSADCSVTVSENGNTDEYQVKVSIEILDVGMRNVEFEIDITPQDATYMCGVVEKAIMEIYPTPLDYMKTKLDEYRALEEEEGIEFSDFLNAGGFHWNIGELIPGIDYVVFVAGVDDSFNVTSEVATAGFTTVDRQDDALFAFDPQMLDALGANITVTPSEGIEYYYYTTVDQSVLDWKFGGVSDLADELYAEFKATIDELVLYMEYTIPEAVNSICWSGTQTFPVSKMIPDTDYYMIGTGVDLYTAAFTTDVYYETFRSPKGGDLSDFSVEFILGDIVFNQIEVNTVPSDNMVRYYFNISPADATEEEIVAELNALIDEYLEYDMIADANGFYSTWCSVGPDVFTFTNLDKGETSVIYAFGIDDEGEIATELMYSEEFTNE